jgi:hypothetical protein
MRHGFSHKDSHVRMPLPLVVRGGLGRTFGSLISFLSLTLLAWGGYILEDAFAHPVDAQAAGLIAAAFFIALGLLLLFYLLKPQTIVGAASARRQSNREAHAAQSGFPTASVITRRGESQRDLAYQRVYVDHFCIRL